MLADYVYIIWSRQKIQTLSNNRFKFDVSMFRSTTKKVPNYAMNKKEGIKTKKTTRRLT